MTSVIIFANKYLNILFQSLKKKTIRLAGLNGFKGETFPDVLNYFKSCETTQPIEDCLKKIKLLDYHQSIANLQRRNYSDAKKNLQDGEIFIEIDFKQKIRIGMSPRQINSEFFKAKLRYLLGIGIYYKKGSKIECFNIDLISDNLGQKGFSVVAALR